MKKRAVPKTVDFPVLVFPKNYDGERWFVADFPDLKGCGAAGKTPGEAIKKATKLALAYLETAQERRESIPVAEDESRFSGRFVVRITRDIHRSLHEKAREKGISLNTLVRDIMADSLNRSIAGPSEELQILRQVHEIIIESQRQLRNRPCLYMEYVQFSYMPRLGAPSMQVRTAFGRPGMPVPPREKGLLS